MCSRSRAPPPWRDHEPAAQLTARCIVEDPATGSAAAATAALLTTLARDGQTERCWRIHQGVDMGRPSVLMARTIRRNGTVEALVGGRCVAVMQGTFEI